MLEQIRLKHGDMNDVERKELLSGTWGMPRMPLSEDELLLSMGGRLSGG